MERNIYLLSGQDSHFRLDIVPAQWAFSIWFLIDIWNMAWIVYSIALFRKPELPFIFPLRFLLLMCSSQFCNTIWLYFAIWIKNEGVFFPPSVAISWVTHCCILVALLILSESLRRHRPLLVKNGYRWERWFAFILAQNGVGLYATWCAIEAPINSGISLYYFHDFEMSDAGTVALTILAVEVCVFVFFDILFLDRWTRYLITPYPTLIWALSAILIRNKVTLKRNSVFTMALLCLVIAATLVKVTVIVWRHKRDSNPFHKLFDVESSSSAKIESVQIKDDNLKCRFTI